MKAEPSLHSDLYSDGPQRAADYSRMRLSVRCVIEALALYPNGDDLRRDCPELEPEDIRQALEFAAQNLGDSVQPLEAA